MRSEAGRFIHRNLVIPLRRQDALRWLPLLWFFAFFSVYLCVNAHAFQVGVVAGDEPHYLLMAHSLVYDRDLDLANNYENRDYWFFHRGELQPHAISNRPGGMIISVHDVGFPLLIFPFYRMAGRWGVVVLQSFVTALTIALCYKALYVHTRSRLISLMVCATIGFSIPVMAFSTQIYPEAVAALLIVWALYRLDRLQCPRVGVWQIAGFSAVMGFLPWLSIKYAIVSAVLALAGLPLLWASPAGRRLKDISSYVGPAFLSGLVWVLVRLRFYGSLSPVAQYGAWGLSLARLGRRMLALLLDQEHGVLPYAPIYILAPVGALVMWRVGRRALLGYITAVFGSFLVLTASWGVWWAGWSFPARFLTAVLPTLALPLGYLCKQVLRSRLRDLSLVLIAGLSVVGVLLGFFAVDDPAYRLLNRRDGSANLFLDLGPQYPDLTRVLPSFPPASSAVRFAASSLGGDVGKKVPDPEREGRWVRVALVDSPSGYLARGARDYLAAGHYRICATVKTEENTRAVAVLRGVMPRHNEAEVFALPIYGAGSLASAGYVEECGELLLDRRTLVEFRLWFNGNGEVGVRDLLFERLGPRSPSLYAVDSKIDFAVESAERHLGAGWSAAESWGRWAVGRSSEMQVHLEKRDTILKVLAFPYPVENDVQRISIYYNDQKLDSFSLDVADARELSTVIPRQAITRGIDTLRFEFGYAWSPAEGGSGDRRALAVGFIALTFTPSP